MTTDLSPSTTSTPRPARPSASEPEDTRPLEGALADALAAAEGMGTPVLHHAAVTPTVSLNDTDDVLTLLRQAPACST